MMKRPGFTLIETMVSIYILTIVLFTGISLSKFGLSMNSQMKNSEFIYEIQNLVSYGKAVCREKNKNGKIAIELSENQLRFVEGWDGIEKIVKIPKEIEMYSTYKNIWINPYGKISTGGRMELKDKYGRKTVIKVDVTTDDMNIYDGDDR